jgi:hypothetical protein
MRGKANYTGENYNRIDSNEGLDLTADHDKIDEVIAVSNPIS